MWVIVIHTRETVRKVKDSHKSAVSKIKLKHNNIPKYKPTNSNRKLNICLLDVMWLLNP